MAETVHVAMLPWLAFGHLIPFLQLSVALAKAGFRISFLSTPNNIKRLPKLPPHFTCQITFVELPLPHVDGLDEGAEATSDLKTAAPGLLEKAYDLLSHHFERFVADHSPDFIIHDLLACWTADIARKHGIPRVLFSIFSACMLAFLRLTEYTSVDELREQLEASAALTSSPPWIPSPSTVALLPREADRLCKYLFGPNASGVSVAQRCLSSIQGCVAIAPRSCDEYEGEHLAVLRKFPKPVIPVGLLPPEKWETVAVGEKWEGISRWLDEKPPRSVVFVVFGSECKPSRSEIYEIALGLELSEVSFLWALRRPAWAADDSDVLPIGFATRNLGRGFVNLGWAPQLEILAHPAVGGCMFHAGWSSMIETVGCGLGLVFLPFSNLQRIDARVAQEKGLGLEIERDNEGMFHRDAIARTLRRAMIGEDGENLRLRSLEMMAIFSDQQLHGQYLSKFIDLLKTKKL